MSRVIRVVCCNDCKHYSFGDNKSFLGNDREFFTIYSEELAGEITKGYKHGDCVCDNEDHIMAPELSVSVDPFEVALAVVRGAGVIVLGLIVVITVSLVILWSVSYE